MKEGLNKINSNWEDINLKKLKKLLESNGIDLSLWGVGCSKTPEHLYKEIREGESRLIKNKEGELVREVIVGGADIYYITADGKKFRLIEEKQVFKNGSQRSRNLGQPVSEKMKINEDPREAVLRGIEEELGVRGGFSLSEDDVNEEVLISNSYPGLKSRYIWHRFKVIFDDKNFDPNGYVEVQADKKTYFSWLKQNE